VWGHTSSLLAGLARAWGRGNSSKTFRRKNGKHFGKDYKIETDYNEDLNSPWDALWYGGDYEDLNVLLGQLRLHAVWKAPEVRVQLRDRRPDFYVFQGHWAVTDAVRSFLLPLVKDTVAFLPITVANDAPLFAATSNEAPLFVVHPRLRCDLDGGAVVSCNEVSGNITVIRQYSFPAGQPTMHIFQLRHPVGSHSRDAGIAYLSVLVSREFKELCEHHGVRGVRWPQVFPPK
jgi:hypothetical protein